jgi:excisionase family DNA binding protein
MPSDSAQFEMLSVAEAAQIARVSSSTVRKWITDGHLIAHRYVGRLIRIQRSDLEIFIVRSKTGGVQNWIGLDM